MEIEFIPELSNSTIFKRNKYMENVFPFNFFTIL